MNAQKIAQTKVVIKHGKPHTQTYWVNPDNASSAALLRASGQKPQSLSLPVENFDASYAAKEAATHSLPAGVDFLPRLKSWDSR